MQIHIFQTIQICLKNGDWKDEKEDFICFVTNLEGFKTFDLTLNSDWSDDDGSIANWSSILDRKWGDKGCHLAAIDIESDSYVLFICDGKTLEELQACSEPIGYKIGPAKEM